MSDTPQGVTLPAGQYKLELWGPMRSGAVFVVHKDVIVLGHSIETSDAPTMVPSNGQAPGRVLAIRQRQFSLMVAIPQEPE